jgi:hypothetical protein
MDYRDLSTRLKYAIHPAHWTFQKYTQWHKELEKAAFERSVAGILHPYATRRCSPPFPTCYAPPINWDVWDIAKLVGHN